MSAEPGRLRLRAAASFAALLGFSAPPRSAEAQGLLQRLSIRGELGVGLMPPLLQRDRLGFDSAHLQVTGRVGFDVIDWLSPQLSVNNGFFFASGDLPLGRTLALQLGLRVQPRVGRAGRIWADVNPGYYSSGADRRFGLDAGIGFEFTLGRAFALGPAARLHWIPADTAIHQPSDALYLSFGLSFTLRSPPAPAPVVRDRDADGVGDVEDACPTTPRGATPDPARRGCPDEDQDRDGVRDREDRCPTTPRGATPDPARQGCPDEDQDRDGLRDVDDACPSEPQGARPDPSRRGCPVGDRDRDGVTDDVDRCPELAETINGRDDDDGCPEGRANGAFGGGRIRLSEPIRFRSDGAELQGRRNATILDAVAALMRTTPEISMLHVEGHTDSHGDADRNRALATRRAGAVIEGLISRGVAASRLTAHGVGPDHPVAAGRSRRARAANRRIEFRVELDAAGARER